MTPANDIVEYARTWLGCKWRHQGRGEGTPPTLDCAGLLILTARHFNLPHEDLKGYGRNPARAFIQQIETFTDQGDLNGPMHGAIGVFNDTVMPCHTGIFSQHDNGDLYVIHAECKPRRVCHEESFGKSFPSLRDRLVSVRLFKDVEYV